ncbi:MAG: alcohol dehydrogenase catalytic domain-containing protein [Terriglobales bacterium]
MNAQSSATVSMSSVRSTTNWHKDLCRLRSGLRLRGRHRATVRPQSPCSFGRDQDNESCHLFLSAHGARAFLHVENVPRPQLKAGHILLRVVACGVCSTDLHIGEEELPPIRPQLIPGHKIVGEVVEGAAAELPLGIRVGVSWIGSVDTEGGHGIDWKWSARRGATATYDRAAISARFLRSLP